MAENPERNQRPFGVVRVEPSDDIASIRGKVEAVSEDVVVLAVSSKARQLRSPLYLRLLRRYGDNLAKDIVIAASDGVVRSLAQSEGFRTFPSLEALDRKWARLLRRGGLSWRDILDAAKVVALVVAGIAILGAIVFFVATNILPSAVIVIKPTSQIVSTTMSVTARVGLNAPNYEANQAPAQIVEASLETTARIETTGSRIEPDQPAKARVTFINRSDQAVIIPRGTLVGTSDGIRFSTEGEVNLSPMQGSTGSVTVVAVEPGTSGNVRGMAIDRVFDSGLALRVVVVNENPAEGGSNKSVKLVTERDQARLLERVKEAALAEAKKHLGAMKRPDESIYDETIQVRVVNTEFEQGVGEVAPVLSVKARVTATGIGFQGSDVNRLAAQRLVRSAGGGEIQAQSLRTRPLEAFSWDKDQVSFNLFAQGRVMPILNRDEIRDKLAGLTKGEAESYLLKNFQLAAPPAVTLYPGWASTLPRLSWRIDVQVASEG